MENIEKRGNMTESEIMKSFELCFAEKGTTHTCGQCPYHKFGNLCKVMRDNDVIDLLNHKNMKIKEKSVEADIAHSEMEDYLYLKECYKRLLKKHSEAQEEIEALQAENKDIVIIRGEGGKIVEKGHIVYLTVEQIEQKARAEAIKVVLQKVKAHKRKMQSSDWSGDFWDYAVLVADIDQIAKEMGVE